MILFHNFYGNKPQKVVQYFYSIIERKGVIFMKHNEMVSDDPGRAAVVLACTTNE